MKKLFPFAIVFLFSKNIIAQNVGIGTNTPNASAQLDISASNKGILIPRVSLLSATDVITVPSPTVSLLVCNINTSGVGALAVHPGYYYWDSNRWVSFVVSDNSTEAAWLLGGNGGTSASNNFIGTVDNQLLRFKITGNNAGYLGLDGNTYWGFKSGNAASTGFSNVAIGSAALSQTSNRSNIVAVGDSALFNNSRGTSVSTEAINNTAVGSKALYKNDAGAYNTAIGYNALMQNSSGVSNTATGNEALRINTTGTENTANGKSALILNTTGSFNTSNGASSLNNNSTGNNNTATGTNALQNNTTGNSNVAVGINTLKFNTTKNNLVAIGDSALLNNGIGASAAIDATANTALGSKALYTNTIGNNNTASGQNSLTNNTIGNNNTAAGANALLSNTTGNNNTANGQSSLQNNITGNANTAIGTAALNHNVSANNNVANGFQSLFENTTGFSNTAVGMNALNKNTNRSNLVAVGDSALYNNGVGAALSTEATGNTAIGSKALFTNGKGYNNTAIGSKTLFSNTTGNYNTATGVQSLYYDTSGSYNTGTGYNALTNNTNGSNNTATGFQSLLSNTIGVNNTANGTSSLALTSTGINNTANGYLSLFGNTTGNNNTAVGASSLISNTTGYSNVGVGINALNSNTTGSNSVAIGDSSLYNNGVAATNIQGKENTAIGSKALFSNTIGNNNTALGTGANVAANNLNNATAIGNKSFVNCSNCMVLGSINGLNAATASVKVGIGTSTPLMGIHVAKTDSAVALFENTQALNTNTSNAVYFKTGSGAAPYTGAVKTIGESTNAARMGLFTYASTSPNQLLERLSITDAGKVGISTTNPLMKLHIVNTDSAVALLENTQALNTNVSNALYFKTGGGILSYTGAVKTIGENTGAARLGMFTSTSFSPNQLQERMSITDNGNVGIGTTTPLMKFHVTKTDSAVALFENTQTLNTNVNTALYFKTGNGAVPYTGAIKTIGENTSSARLGFFTYASISGNSLKERMSISDAGNVGIGVITPQADLHINPAGAGSLLIGTNKFAGGYTTLEAGITAQSGGYGYIQTTKSSGTAFGDLVINQSGGNVGIGTAALNVNTKLTINQSSGNYSGLAVTANGLTASPLIPQAAIIAKATNGADALVIDGPIRSSNSNDRVIYKMTTQIVNSTADGYLDDTYTGVVTGQPDGFVKILINNPLCNGDPNAIIFYSWLGYYEKNKNFQSFLGYSSLTQRWYIQYYYDTYLGGSNNGSPSLNIMIVKQ
jgi:trimeric autotransporter adhesin